MKAEFKEGILTLRGDSDEEKQWLDKAFTEGLRVFGGGSYTSVCLPSVSNTKQFHFTDKELAMIQGSLKQCENVLSFVNSGELASLEKKLGMFNLLEFLEKSREVLKVFSAPICGVEFEKKARELIKASGCDYCSES